MQNVGYTGLRQAFLKRDLQKVERLLAKGTDVEVKSTGGNTSLHWSVENNFVEG